MENIARRSVLTAAALTTAGALALTPVTAAPLNAHSPIRISTQTVALTDAWSQLFTDTASSVTGLVTMTIGANNNYPLPSPTFPLAPVVTQLVLNQFAYAGLLLTGQGGQIPGVDRRASDRGRQDRPTGHQCRARSGVRAGESTVFFAAAQTLEFIANSANPLTALFQAPPAVFLNIALNSQYGLLGFTGPIGLSLIFRNLLANAVYTPLPSVVLPFKTASKAAAQPKAAATPTPVKPAAAPSGTASSARSKHTAPSSAASSKRRPSASTKTDAKGADTGRGRSNRK